MWLNVKLSEVNADIFQDNSLNEDMQEELQKQ